MVAKLKSAHTNDTLCDMSREVILEKISFPNPEIAVAIRGENRGDEDKLGVVLPKLHEEDPTFLAEFDPELHQTIARGLGELHLAVQLERMKRKYGVAVMMEQPKIGYRETITKEAEGQGRHKKQSGGRGQFGDCWIRLKPRTAGKGYEFVSSIKGGVIPTKYVPSVDKGIQEAAARGVLAGFRCVDFEAECYDGSYHAVDSSDIAFKLAGSAAFKNVAGKCRPVILEPIIEVTVTTPDDYVGDIMSDMNQRRGKVLGMEPTAGRTTVKALVPEAELYKSQLDDAVAANPGCDRPTFAVMRHTAVYDSADDWMVPVEAAQRQLSQFENLFKNLGDVENGFPRAIPLDQVANSDDYEPATLSENLMFGTPDEVIAKLRRYEALGVDEFIYYASLGLGLPEQKRSMELFCNEVIPAFS